jgi:hypothetical protein
VATYCAECGNGISLSRRGRVGEGEAGIACLQPHRANYHKGKPAAKPKDGDFQQLCGAAVAEVGFYLAERHDIC